MSELTSVPLTEVLGDRNAPVKIEESWSKDVPQVVGADAHVQELNRSKLIAEALKRPSGRRLPQPNAGLAIVGNVPNFQQSPLNHHFFVLKGRKLEFIGSKEMDASKFQKDVSGRFFREWLKKSFPERRDHDEIISFDDNTTLKEITDLMGLCE